VLGRLRWLIYFYEELAAETGTVCDIVGLVTETVVAISSRRRSREDRL
jgi:hypothetical protein